MKKVLLTTLLLGVTVVVCLAVRHEVRVAQAGVDCAPLHDAGDGVTLQNFSGSDRYDPIAQAVYLLSWAFLGGDAPVPLCPDPVIAELQAQLAATQAEVASVQQTQTELQGQLTTCQDDLVVAQDDLTAAQARIAELEVPGCMNPNDPNYNPCANVADDSCAYPEIDGFSFTGENVQGYPEYVHQGTYITFVLLPAGTFNMGAQATDANGENYYADAPDYEGPVHAVTVSPFLIAKYELTQAQWQQVMGSNPSFFDGEYDADGNPIVPPYERDNLPVEQVSWNDIQAFEDTTGLRLPTEAQWEYACRAGPTEPNTGNGVCGDMGWYRDNCDRSTHPVGEKLPNQFGLYDVHGNVWEWCEDWFQRDFYAEALGATDPLCTNSDSGERIRRGVSYGDYTLRCRSAQRSWVLPSRRGSGLGVRPAFWPLP